MPRKTKALKVVDYKGVVAFMADGGLDCDLYSALNCSETFFKEQLKNDVKLLDAFEQGLAKCEKFYVDQYREVLAEEVNPKNGMLTINKERLKGIKNILDSKFKWNSKDFESLHTQINVGTITIHNNKSRTELLEFIKDEMIDQGVIDLHESDYQLVEPDNQD